MVTRVAQCVKHTVVPHNKLWLCAVYSSAWTAIDKTFSLHPFQA